MVCIGLACGLDWAASVVRAVFITRAQISHSIYWLLSLVFHASCHLQNSPKHLYMFPEIEMSPSGLQFLIKALKVKVQVTQSSLNLSPQARIPEWVAFPFCRGSSLPRDQTQVSHTAGRVFTS